jgi:serine/threonine-protein kinase
VILYEMLTGSPPFTGQNHFQLLYKHGNEAPDPPSQRSKHANIPPHVEAAVLRAMEKDPAHRYQTMNEFCDALRGPVVPRRARTVGIPLLVAALAAGVVFLLWPTSEPALPDDSATTEVGAVLDPGAVPTPSPSDTATNKSGDPAEPAEPAPIVDAAPEVQLALDSRPQGAFVWVNGEKRGRTPLAVELEAGVEATVRFSLPGYRGEVRQLVPNEDDSLLVRLKKKTRPKPSPIKTDF